MAIFSGLQVNINGQLSTTWVQYGSKDRVVASILAANTQNKPIKLPAMAAYLNNINLAPELRKGVNTVRTSNFLPRGGLMPNDIKTVYQLMPVPYKLSMELSIFTSNTNQHFEILEQILLLFDPQLQIQTSTDAFDWTKISTVELTNIKFDQEYPSGTTNRAIQSTLEFEIPFYLSAPYNLRNDVITQVNVRLGALDSIVTGAYTSQQLVQLFDEEGIDYQTVVDAFPDTIATGNPSLPV